jgi:hypothetical protein
MEPHAPSANYAPVLGAVSSLSTFPPTAPVLCTLLKLEFSAFPFGQLKGTAGN